MNVSALILLSSFWVLVQSKSSPDSLLIMENESNLVEAVHLLALKVFTTKTMTIGLIEVRSTSDFRQELLRKIFSNSEIVLRQDTTQSFSRFKRQRRGSMVLIRSFQDFLEMYSKLTSDTFKFNGIFMIVLIDGKIAEIPEIFSLLWKIRIFNSIVIFESEKAEVFVQSFKPFKPGKCNDTTPIIIDQFENGKFNRSAESYFLNNMKDLQKCPIRAAISNTSDPYLFVKKLPSGGYELSGRDFDLMKALSESLNFKLNYTFVGPVGYLLDNGSSAGPLRSLMDGEADITVSNWFLKENRVKYFDMTTAYFADSLVFLIPPGRDFKSYEKLIFPFSISLWFAILTTFLIAFVTIFAINLCPSKVQNFVFGTGVTYPTLNVAAGFLGGSQKILPTTSFARYLLMLFLLYSLILRAVYQASFYQLLQANTHHKEVQSMNEMIENNFTFYTMAG